MYNSCQLRLQAAKHCDTVRQTREAAAGPETRRLTEAAEDDDDCNSVDTAMLEQGRPSADAHRAGRDDSAVAADPTDPVRTTDTDVTSGLPTTSQGAAPAALGKRAKPGAGSAGGSASDAQWLGATRSAPTRSQPVRKAAVRAKAGTKPAPAPSSETTIETLPAAAPLAVPGRAAQGTSGADLSTAAAGAEKVSGTSQAAQPPATSSGASYEGVGLPPADLLAVLARSDRAELALCVSGLSEEVEYFAIAQVGTGFG